MPTPPPTDEGLAITFFGKVNESLDLTLKFIMAFGLCFQLPVLLTLMGKAGLVSARGLASMRKYAMVGILVVAALAATVAAQDVVVLGHDLQLNLDPAASTFQSEDTLRVRGPGVLDIPAMQGVTVEPTTVRP